MQALTGINIKLDIAEIKEPDLEAKLVAENVANQLERRISHRRAMQRAVDSAMRAGAEGVKVMCAGRVDPPMLLSAFEKGAEGVVVIGCKDEECRYGPGPEQGRKLAERMKGLMHVLGLEDERFSTMAYASHEEDRLFAEMNAFAEQIAQMEKSPLARQAPEGQ